MKSTYIILILSLFLSHIAALPISITADVHKLTNQRRSNNTCGDPSVSMTYFEGYNQAINAHSLDLLPNYVSADTVGDGDYETVAPAFRAWIDPGQPSTVPFYFLFNPTTTNYVYLISTAATPPSRSGFDAAELIGYVYQTQICNSVPLYSVFLPDDHYYTTNQAEYNYFLDKSGWSDDGIIAYVLPIDDVSEIVA